jgi:hypothetical protein
MQFLYSYLVGPKPVYRMVIVFVDRIYVPAENKTMVMPMINTPPPPSQCRATWNTRYIQVAASANASMLVSDLPLLSINVRPLSSKMDEYIGSLF